MTSEQVNILQMEIQNAKGVYEFSHLRRRGYGCREDASLEVFTTWCLDIYKQYLLEAIWIPAVILRMGHGPKPYTSGIVVLSLGP